MSRPKVPADVGSLARVHTLSAIRRIEGLAENATNESVRLEANRALLDRGWGKPKQTQVHTGADGEGPVIVRVIYEPRGKK